MRLLISSLILGMYPLGSSTGGSQVGDGWDDGDKFGLSLALLTDKTGAGLLAVGDATRGTKNDFSDLAGVHFFAATTGEYLYSGAAGLECSYSPSALLSVADANDDGFSDLWVAATDKGGRALLVLLSGKNGRTLVEVPLGVEDRVHSIDRLAPRGGVSEGTSVEVARISAPQGGNDLGGVLVRTAGGFYEVELGGWLPLPGGFSWARGQDGKGMILRDTDTLDTLYAAGQIVDEVQVIDGLGGDGLDGLAITYNLWDGESLLGPVCEIYSPPGPALITVFDRRECEGGSDSRLSMLEDVTGDGQAELVFAVSGVVSRGDSCGKLSIFDTKTLEELYVLHQPKPRVERVHRPHFGYDVLGRALMIENKACLWVAVSASWHMTVYGEVILFGLEDGGVRCRISRPARIVRK